MKIAQCEKLRISYHFFLREEILVNPEYRKLPKIERKILKSSHCEEESPRRAFPKGRAPTPVQSGSSSHTRFGLSDF